MAQLVKEKIVEHIRSEFDGLKQVAVVDPKGLTAQENDAFRAGLKEKGLSMRVVHNRLTRVAIRDTELSALADLLEGPSAFIWGDDDAAVLAKAVDEATKEQKKVEIKGGYFDGKMTVPEQVKALAQLPSREQLLGQVAGTIAAPMTGLGRAMNQIILKLGYALVARRDQMEESA
ncbi:MAG: 50S ribosomal protein L10 [Planctomycetota bacterium]